MTLSVTGKNIDVGAALRGHIAASLETVFGKYFGEPIDAHVIMAREAHLFAAQISVHVGRGIQMQSEASANEAYAAYDQAAEHLAKRLRRYKRRLRDHHRQATESLRAPQYVIEAGTETESEDDLAVTNATHAAPAIVAEMETDIPRLTVADAVMRLDLANQPAMLFLNLAHGGLNMVYRRADGHIGWVDPRLDRPASAR